ncbi:integral peroxisomal membrane peroxin-domain-containing protein [Mycotypha africana]|uniref:integral peroxisomal membrane peroxin-domain-containing protein n=1 Tax=Mycotypha africana TaxID=64632 RepID=UPI002301381B|nr:integral peroxisomal membrane peroxin-domain-containing protein [Mycotypha africana]KAI8987361.1 integral peroxisomal membrane peroxin-domain-containing protein [Mycotypha africana]
MTHLFHRTSFSSPTYCDHCDGFLWGISKQGFKCSDCDMVVHSKCRLAASKCSKPSSISAAQYLNNTIQQQHEQQSRYQSTVDNSHFKEDTDKVSLWQSIQQFTTSQEIKDIVISAAIYSSDVSQPVSDYLAHLPPLSAQNTTKNFSRFVSRCGPMFSFRDKVILLLNWHKPVDTMIAMLIYCLICLYPKLVLIVPHVILLQIIISEFSKKYTLERKENSREKNSTEVNSSYSTVTSAQQLSQQSDKIATKQHKDTTKGSRSTGFASIFPATIPNNENSPEYLRNLQNLQNMMGEMSDLHDFIVSKCHYIDWSNESETVFIFQLALLTLLAFSLIISFVSLQSIFLVGGITVFLINTRFAKYILKHLTTAVTEKRKSDLLKPATAILRGFQKSYVIQQLNQQENEVLEISLFENQRWWPDIEAFASQMLPGERGLWTDYSGMILKDERVVETIAPEGYHWIDREWFLDKKGPWVDDQFNREVVIFPDDCGWVYTDFNWKNEARYYNRTDDAFTKDGQIGIYYVTRRRRWVRKCKRNSCV